jgi:hypothetical protein
MDKIVHRDLIEDLDLRDQKVITENLVQKELLL